MKHLHDVVGVDWAAGDEANYNVDDMVRRPSLPLSFPFPNLDTLLKPLGPRSATPTLPEDEPAAIDAEHGCGAGECGLAH